MKRTKLSDTDRARIAQGWRASGLSQPAYAARHLITDRTLRAWLARWVPACPSGADAARKIVTTAIERLQALVHVLDADPTVHPDPEPPASPSAAPASQPDVELTPAAVPVQMPVPSPHVPSEETARERFSWL
jgi:hypothetical protein